METKITNGELARIFSMYWGAEIKVTTMGMVRTPNPVVNGYMLAQIQHNPPEDVSYQLVLKHLSKMSDEDAIDVARILDVNYSDDPEKEMWYDLDRLIDYVSDEIIDGVRLDDITELINYLRSKGYDCDKLISQGLAIEKV